MKPQRWPELHALFSCKLDRQYSAAGRIVDELFLQACEGYERNYWRQLEGFENSRTPLSNHLLRVFTEWAKSFAELSRDFELLFDLFELLGSLAYFEQNSDVGVEQILVQGTPKTRVWMPVGRIGWDRTYRDCLLKQINSENLSTSLLRASFANGRRECLEVFFDNLRLFSDRSGY